MHNDEPVLLDALERGPLIAEVGEVIAGCKPPQVFGVHGDWGLGKTSFLHQVQWYLTGDCPQQPEAVTKDLERRAKEAAEDAPNGNGADDSPAEVKDGEGGASTLRGGVYRDVVQAVWFDAWRYQNEPAPVVALLHEMRAQLAWGSRAARSTARNTKVAVRGALLSMEELTKKIGFQYSKFREAHRDWETENLAAALPSHTLREHLRAAVAQLLPRKRAGKVPPKLVVFIDDVDRCEPEAAYRLLEGLKIYLTLDNCVFVLGMNQKAIQEAIAQRMSAETGDNPTMRAAAYMEKLCQNVWRLPAVRQPGRVLYDLLAGTDHPGVRDWIKRGIEATGQPCLPPNPRRLKGLANLIGRLSSQFPTHEDHDSDEVMTREAQCLLIVACIYQFHHELHVRWELDSDLYKKMYDRCRGVDLDLPFLDSLLLPQQYPEDEHGRTTPTETPESTYPDPTQANIFWIQPLILHLGDGVPLPYFERYLRGTPA